MGYQWEELDQHLIYSSYGDFADFNTPKGAKQLLNVIRQHEVQVLIIDTISRVVTGKENDNDTWNDLHKHLERHLKNEGISLLRLDHTGKDTDKGPRGGSAKLGDVDMTLIITPIVDGSQRLFLENSRMEVSWEKAELSIIKEPVLKYTIHEIHKETFEERLQRLVTLLDDNGIKPDLTVQETRKELKNLGEGGSTTLIAAITKERKNKRAKQAQTTVPRQEWKLHAV
jgi:RecA-family ATPase